MFLPASYYEALDFNEIEFDDFFELIALARIAQKLQISVLNQAIVSAFSDE